MSSCAFRLGNHIRKLVSIGCAGLKRIRYQRYNTSVAKSANMDSFFQFMDYDCIGFDLDNTLARYKVGAMIEMEYNILANYLVDNKGYSARYLLHPLDHNFIIKGLIVDDENGNLLRISSDGTIIQATHGTKFLTQEQLRKYYPNLRWHVTDVFSQDPLQTWNGPYAEKMRTLLDYYDIIASLIFARAVDSIDDDNSERKLYNIWPDLMEALQDMFTREHFENGRYFSEMKAHPEKYYYKSSVHLINWLKTLKSNGKLVFLITGSYVDFASHTATNTLGKDWKSLFDIIVCFAKKPGFFTDRRDFVGVDLAKFTETGPVKLSDLSFGSVYTHGNWTDLKHFLEKHSSVSNPKFLYVGDNLVQDIYAPNVYAGCDTVAVCEELEAEGVYGHEKWHPDEQFLCSTIWGSYFKCKDTGRMTNWYDMMKKHSKFFVPSLEYVAGFPVDHKFKNDMY